MDSQESQGRDDRPVDFEAVMNRLASARRDANHIKWHNQNVYKEKGAHPDG